MINVINTTTNEVIKVDLICNYDGVLAARKFNPEPGTKFYASYPFIVKTDDTIEVDGASKPCRVVTLADGYELKTVRSPRKSKVTEETAAKVTEDTVEQPETVEVVTEDEPKDEPQSQPENDTTNEQALITAIKNLRGGAVDDAKVRQIVQEEFARLAAEDTKKPQRF